MNSTPLSLHDPIRPHLSPLTAGGGKSVQRDEKPSVTGAERRTPPPQPAEPLDPQILRPADWMTLEGLTAQFGQTDSLYDLDQDGVVGTSDMFTFLQYQADPDRFANAPQVETPDGTSFMTITDLLANYGRSDSPFDLDRDGIVGTSDLFALQQTLASPAPVESAASEPVVQPGMTLEGLMAAYGSDNAAYDLDGSGAVDYNDMFTFLQNMPDSENAPPAPEPNPTLEGLLTSFGQSHPTYDIDSNGTVDVADMFAFLQGQAAQATQSQGVQAGASPRGLEFKPRVAPEKKPLDTPASRPTFETRTVAIQGGAGSAVESQSTGGPTVQEVVDKILANLKEAGFTTVPPTNLHALLGKLNFAPKFEQAVLQQLSTYFENGLGVDRTA